MRKAIVPFHRACINSREKDLIIEALDSGWLTMGPKTIEFEERFKEYCEVDYAVSMNSATAALHLALKAIGIKRGDEVIIPTCTFIATAEVITYFDAVPILCDVEYETHNLDAGKLKQLITSRTKAIIPVHFAGQICDMDEILTIAEDNKLKVIEDAAHCLPSYYKGKKVGSFSDITCFSFYATKTLCTGEGGMATTSNIEYSKSMKINRLHGISRDAWDRYSSKGNWYYEVVDNGNKYNTTDMNSALGIAQLEKLEVMHQNRINIATRYDAAFKGKIEMLTNKEDRVSSNHLYVIKVNNRNSLIDILKDHGITSSVHFIPVHKHPYYKNKYQYCDESYPVANEVFEKSLSLPIYPGMTSAETDYVIENVLRFAK